MDDKLTDEVDVRAGEQDVVFDVMAIDAVHQVLFEVTGSIGDQCGHPFATVTLPQLQTVFPNFSVNERRQVVILEELIVL